MAKVNPRRTPEELKDPQYNYYIAFDLEITDTNPKLIEQAVKQKLGNTAGSDLRLRRLLELKDDILEIMVNDAKYNSATGEYEPKKGARKEEAARATEAKLCDAVKMIENMCSKSGRTSIFYSDLENIRLRSKRYFTVEELKKRVDYLQKQGIKIIDNIDKTMPFNEYKKIEDNLLKVKKKDLYDFLGVTQKAKADEINIAHDKTYSEGTKTNELSRKQAVSALCSSAKTLLLNSDSKYRTHYDYYLKLKESVWSKLELNKTYGMNLSMDEYGRMVQTAMQALGVKLAEAERIIAIGCKYYNTFVEGKEGESNLETCPFCNKVYKKGLRACPHCGKQSKVFCWNCNEGVSPQQTTCPRCGVNMGGRQRFVKYTVEFDTLIKTSKTSVRALQTKVSEMSKAIPEKAANKNYFAGQEIAKCENALSVYKKKHKGKTVAIISTSSVLAFILVIFSFIFFSFWLPLMQFPVNTEKLDGGEYTVTSVKDETREYLEIGGLVPKFVFTDNKVVVSISDEAFEGNSHLRKVICPSSLNTIGSRAFADCKALNTLVIRSENPPEIENDSFNGTAASFLVPLSAYDSYLKAPDWSGYESRIFPDYGNDDSHGCIMFDSRGGNAVAAIESHELNTVYPALTAPVRHGYDFVCWQDVNTGKTVTGGATVMTGNVKLAAVWSPSDYTITYETNGGNFASDPVSKYTYGYGITSLPVPEKAGWEFAGWYTDSSFGGTAVGGIPSDSTGDKTFYANWITTEYDIYYETNGGRFAEVVDTKYTVASETVILPEPVRDGYSFEGWFANEELKGNEQQEIPKGSRGDKYFYAKWSLVRYKVEYVTNGGDIRGTAVQEFTVESEELTLPTPEKQGYVFDGWYLSENLSGLVHGNIPPRSTGDKTYYAKWTPCAYTLKFETFGGEQTESEVKFGENVVLSVPGNPSAGDYSQGYLFAGWSLQLLNGNGDPGARVEWETVPYLGENTSEVTLYAIWEAVPANWFNFNSSSGELLVSGLTPEWEKYDGAANKYDLTFPATYGAGAVKGIAENAFAGNASIKKVHIPDSFTTIGAGAFKDCTALAEITGGAGIVRVDAAAFAETPWYRDKFDAGSWFLTLGKTAVKYNQLGGIEIEENFFPEKVTSLAAGLFEGIQLKNDDGIAWAYLPSRITYVGARAFADSSFCFFSLPSAAQYGEGAFENVWLSSVTFYGGTVDLGKAFGENARVFYLNFTGDTSTLKVSGGGAMVDDFRAEGKGYTQVSLDSFEHIGRLMVNDNKISKFEVAALKPVKSIGTLYLTNNKLTSINITDIFANQIILTGNEITAIYCIGKNEAIRVIHTPSEGVQNKNKLASLSFTQYLPSLVSLDVANNNVSVIEGIEKLENLQELYLGGNPVLNNDAQLKLLDKDTLCAKFVRLNLGDSTLTSRVLSIVKKSVNLKWLQIYNIGITAASQLTGAISKSTHAQLSYLKISHNGISSVPSALSYIEKVVIEYGDSRQN